MKNALLGALFVAATIGGSAQKMAIKQPRLATEQIPFRLTASDLTPHFSVKPEEGTQATTFKRVFTTDIRSQFHYWPYGTASNDIFKYDPASKSLNISRNKAILTGGSLTGVDIGIMRSTNNGSTWSFDIIQNTTDLFFGMPTFGWINPDGGTNPAKFATAVYGIRYPMPNLTYGGMSLWNRTSAGSYEMILSDQQPPAAGYTVQFGDLYSDNTSGAVHYAGTLDPDNTAQYGAYGYFNFNLIVEDFGVFPTIPNQWSVDKFRPSEQLTSSYNAPVLLEGDESGNLYACFNNFAADNLEVRGVQISKSADQGKKWDEFVSMPNALLEEFAAATGGDVAFQPGQSPYQGGSLIVTGDDALSYFTRIATGIANKDNPSQIDSVVALHIVEVAYKSGSWKMRPVAPLASFGFRMVAVQDSISQAIGAPAITLADNGRGHEIQVAKTADGKHLVVKYVEINPTRENTFTAPVRVYEQVSAGQYNELDPIASNFDTDLFVTTRELTSETWTDAINCTNDADHAFRTYIPDVVPSLTQIPILRLLGSNAGSITSLLPKGLYQLIYNSSASMDFAMVNLKTVGVQEEMAYDFRFNNIAPNPVSRTAEVTFTLDRPATVTLEVFDMVGNNLGVVFGQQLQQGIHGVTVDASAFATGTYNLALVVNGVRTTKQFVVVR
ncbi:MAG: T9SS type A sorting domain-containing protein [Ignavibacteria bacterium]|nr:T9SS type A sorting domain-containing protein [Ignavibacteria bacterium]